VVPHTVSDFPRMRRISEGSNLLELLDGGDRRENGWVISAAS